jgi:hypothetical protein
MVETHVQWDYQYMERNWGLSARKSLYVQKQVGNKPQKLGEVIKATYQGTGTYRGQPTPMFKLQISCAPEASQNVDLSFGSDDSMYISVRLSHFSLFEDVDGWNLNHKLQALFNTIAQKRGGKWLKTFIQQVDDQAAASFSQQKETHIVSLFSEGGDSDVEGQAAAMQQMFDTVPDQTPQRSTLPLSPVPNAPRSRSSTVFSAPLQQLLSQGFFFFGFGCPRVWFVCAFHFFICCLSLLVLVVLSCGPSFFTCVQSELGLFCSLDLRKMKQPITIQSPICIRASTRHAHNIYHCLHTIYRYTNTNIPKHPHTHLYTTNINTT